MVRGVFLFWPESGTLFCSVFFFWSSQLFYSVRPNTQFRETFSCVPTSHRNTLSRETFSCVPTSHRNTLFRETFSCVPTSHHNTLFRETFFCVSTSHSNTLSRELFLLSDKFCLPRPNVKLLANLAVALDTIVLCSLRHQMTCFLCRVTSVALGSTLQQGQLHCGMRSLSSSKASYTVV